MAPSLILADLRGLLAVSAQAIPQRARVTAVFGKFANHGKCAECNLQTCITHVRQMDSFTARA